MSADRLIRHIDKLLIERGLSARKACLKAHEINPSVGVDFIRDMKRRGHVPRSDKLIALAQSLEVAPAELLNLVEEPHQRAPTIEQCPTTFLNVPLLGSVQAGKWQSDFIIHEFHAEEYIAAPMDTRFPGIPRVAFRVLGDSMDLVFPPGTIVLAVRFFDLARQPLSGEKVIVIRQKEGFEEATIKEIEILSDGRIALWPRSSNPEHSAAIIATDMEAVFADDGSHPEVRVEALVTQSIRFE